MSEVAARRRHEERIDFTDAQRIRLLEGDVDDFETSVLNINNRITKLFTVAVGLLVSITTAVIMLALNLIVNHA